MDKLYDIIVYHIACNDGISSLWSALYFKDVKEKVGCRAGSNPDINYANKSIIFVDICPTMNYIIEAAKDATFITILDHHKTALEAYNGSKEDIPDNVEFILDMNRAGCQITWDYFFPNNIKNNIKRPWFIDYVADRDLWKHELPNSKEICAALYDKDYFDTSNINKLDELVDPNEDKIKELISYGSIIINIHKRELNYSANHALEATMDIDDKSYKIWLGTTSFNLRSDLGNILAYKKFQDGETADFAAIWSYDLKADEWYISLRGRKESPDLSVIANKAGGGGGHKLAAGFAIKNGKNIRDIFTIN